MLVYGPGPTGPRLLSAHAYAYVMHTLTRALRARIHVSGILDVLSYLLSIFETISVHAGQEMAFGHLTRIRLTRIRVYTYACIRVAYTRLRVYTRNAYTRTYVMVLRTITYL